MMPNDKKMRQAGELICRVLEGNASPEEIRQLEERLHRDTEVLGLYTQIADTIAELTCPGNSMGISYQIDKSQLPGLDRNLWLQLLNYEKTAPALDVPKPASRKCQPIENTQPAPTRHRISRFSLITFITSMAALIFLILLVQLDRSRPTPVATVADCFNAQWASQLSPEAGSRLNNGSTLRLKSGYVKLHFDHGAEVILEGPSKFELDSYDQMRLISGKMSAVVPPAAAGFRVNTSVMSVTDLGTEFSIRMDEGGGIVNLYTGRASVLAGEEGHRKGSHVLAEGQARRVDAITKQIEQIALDGQSFVRRLDSQKGFLWRGESVDLASVVAGGDGFTSVPGIAGIDPGTGKSVRGYNYRIQKSSGTYQPVSDNPFVDGVFIPDGGVDKTVSSAGHIFEECPDTGTASDPDGLTSHSILTFCDFDERQVALKPYQLPVFDNVAMGTAQSPAVLIHSNAGITFDLDAVRNKLAGAQIQRLACSFGLPNKNELVNANADVWVLLDGQIRYEKRALVQSDGLISLAVDISPAERFLTIAVTDAATATRDIDNDYVYLIEPHLELAATN